MVARFIRYFGVSDQEVMKMPARRFFVLHAKIGQLQAEEDMRAVANYHAPKPEERLKQLERIYSGKGETHANKPAASHVRDTPQLAQFEQQKGEILAERERQKESAERLKAEWQEKLRLRKEQQAQSSQE